MGALLSSNKAPCCDEHHEGSSHIHRVPKHLKPTKPSKKQQKRLQQNEAESVRHRRKSGSRQCAVPTPKIVDSLLKNDHPHRDSRINRIFGRATHHSNSTVNPRNTLLGDEVDDSEHGFSTVGSLSEFARGGAYRWLQGRRFHNVKGLRYVLPNDQRELDRLRVQSYIIRWAFGGYTLAPVHDKPEDTDRTKVLSMGCGPGLWLGHPVIDMALDGRHADFFVVDINDLLPLEQIPYFTKEIGDTPTSSSAQPSSDMAEYPWKAEGQSVTQQQRRHHHQQQHLPSKPTTATQDSTNGQPGFTPIHPALSSYLESHSLSQDPSIFMNAHKDSAYTLNDCDNKPAPSTHLAAAADDVNQQQRKLFGNLTLHIHNILKGRLPFPNDSFDIVYQSQANFSYTPSDWKYVLSELLRVTKPGGYIQLIENDLYFNLLGPVASSWQDRFLSAFSEKLGVQPHIARQLPEILVETGWVDIESRHVSIPLGNWGLDIGILWQQNLEAFVQAVRPGMSEAMDISFSQYKEMWSAISEELERDDCKAFSNVHAAWARKPVTNTIDFSPPIP